MLGISALAETLPTGRDGRTRQGSGKQGFMKRNPSRSRTLPVIGWREWVALPELGIAAIKPKVDTGARSSSLHAVGVEEFRKDGRPYVRFRVHPIQRDTTIAVTAEAEILEKRGVRSSDGTRSLRPVIVTDIEVMGQRWPIELTLADRDEMGFRMLLGRQAIRGRFLVDAGASYHGGKRRERKKIARRREPNTRPHGSK